MSKAYKQIAEGYRMLAEGYEALAADGRADVKTADKGSRKAETAVETKQAETEAQTESVEETRVTIEDIRAVMRAKNKEGKIEKCQAVLKEYGVVKLSDVPEEKYPELLKKVEVL